MVLHSEIKDFVRKVLLLAILLSFLINLLFTYYRSVSGGSTETYASGNDATFKQTGIPYLGDTWVALSLNVGLKLKDKQDTPVRLYEDVMPLAEVLADKSTGQKKIISSNMVAASEYLNILRTDVNKLLDQSNDREAMLESFLDQLKYRYKTTDTYISRLQGQIAELNTAISTSSSRVDSIKSNLTTAYKNLDYDKTEELIDSYLKEKEAQTYAETYLVFLTKFANTYTVLNSYNKTLLDTLINNKEALIKNVTVVLPDSGTDLMKKLNLIKTEAEAKAAQ